jgi:hypothetical protein
MNNKKSTERSWMNAVTFAEAGEWETAIALTPLPTKGKWSQFFEQAFMAVAFAEAGLHEDAMLLAGTKRRVPKRIKSFLDSIGLQNARMAYGILQEGAPC